MKRLSAIVLSLLLFWVQGMAVAPMLTVDALAKSDCCSSRCNCCVSRSDSSGSVPLPAVPFHSVQVHQNLFTLTAPPAWLLPRGEANFVSVASASSQAATRVPLFTRDCALLI